MSTIAVEGRAQEGGPDVFWTGQVNHLNYQAFRVNGKENIWND